jgi:hypothetical protein
MLRGRWVLITITVIAVIAIAGCTSPLARKPAPVSRPTTPSVSPSPAGDFSPNSRLLLANGASLTVPSEWKAKLITAGGLVVAAPEESGVLGGTMDFSRASRYGSVAFSVYGPKAGFAAGPARLERIYQSSLKSAFAKARFAVTRTDLTLVGGTTGTAYFTAYKSRPPHYEFEIFIQRAGANPLLIGADFNALPQGFDTVPRAQLSQRFLEYLGFAWP